jgi:hypothetical protein
MSVDTMRKGSEKLDTTIGNKRWRRKTDITQPLDYEAKELVKEFIESQQRPTSFPQFVLPKLFRS